MSKTTSPVARSSIVLLAFAVLLTGWLCLPTNAVAQTPDIKDLTTQTTVWKQRLDQISEEIKASLLSETDLAKIAREIEQTGEQAEAFITTNTPFAQDAKALHDKLGPAPKEGEPEEPEAVAKQRLELAKRQSDLDSAIASAGTLKTRAAQMRKLISAKRRDLFAEEVLRQNRSPFSVSVWREGVPALARAGGLLSDITSGWNTRHSSQTFWLLFLGVLAIGAGLQMMMRRFIAIYRTHPGGPPPPFFRQAASAGVVSVMRALPLVLAASLFYAGLSYFNMLTAPFNEIAPIALISIAAFAAIAALSTTLLAPNRPLWRIIPVSSKAARRLNQLLILIAVVFGIDLFLNYLSKTLLMPLSLTVLQSAISSVLFAGLLTAVLRTPLQTHMLASSGAQTTPRLVRLLKLPLWAVVFIVLGATALGYISLARFLSQQTVITGSILITVYLAHLAINEFTDSFGNIKSTGGRLLDSMFAMSQQRREQVGAVSMLLLNLMLILLTLPLLALQWGSNQEDVTGWLRKFLFGFEFGGLKISLSVLLIACGLFLLGTMLTRMFQGWLDQRILSKSQSQTGAENSIKTAIGYLGFVLSALIAVSYTGIGFSNIAIVAGALSVGIGFGLQSIVNNFVSGLILLAERPIKVGDWIVVGNDEGNVRRISVRSTEIETFDRAQIIIPNSELISGTVKNWTLRGRLGRIIIRVGVSYDADPPQVQELLLEIANDNDMVLEYPAAFVVFEDFGASSLDFSLRCYVADITNSLSVRTALRMEIHKRFRDNNIEIPFPQQDLHLRDMDRLEQALQPPQNAQQSSGRRRNNRRKKSSDNA